MIIGKHIIMSEVIKKYSDEKALVLENGFEMDIPKELTDYLKDENIEWEWYDTRFSFWKENREATMKFFSELPVGKRIYCHTCFDGFMQLELFIELLFKFKDKKFTFKIMHGCLAEDLLEFYNEDESSIPPKELEDQLEKADTDEKCKAVFKAFKNFKQEMNKKFLEVLSCHDIYWVNYHTEYLFKNLQDIEKANS